MKKLAQITNQQKTVSGPQTAVQHRLSGTRYVIEESELQDYPADQGWVNVGLKGCLKQFVPQAPRKKKTLAEAVDVATTQLNEDQTLDPVGAALIHLEDIATMIDDMNTTISELDSVSLTIVDQLGKIYDRLANVYELVDAEYSIVPAHSRWADQSDSLDDYQIFDSGEGVMEEKQGFVDFAKSKGFKEAPISKDTYKSDDVKELYGIPMRAGKFADIFVGIFNKGGKDSFGIVGEPGVNKYANENDAKRFLAFIIKNGVNMWDAYNEDTGDYSDETLRCLFEGFYRIPTKMLKNEYRSIIMDMKAMYDELVKGNDFDYKRFNGYISSMQRILKSVKEFNSEDEVDKTIFEEVDATKIRTLGNLGLVDSKSDVPQLVKALTALEEGKNPTPQQRTLMVSTLQRLISLVTGDASVFTKTKAVLASDK